jgi:hypothetical protein
LGKAVIKDSRLALLCTTSLYQTNPSQYNRIKVPCHLAGGKDGDYLSYQELGYTSGFGTDHLSAAVTKGLHQYEAFRRELIKNHTEGMEREKTELDENAGTDPIVNYIFGEGVSPRLRRLRNTVSKLGFSENVFKHGNSRVIYGLALTSNFEQILLGQQKRPKYFLPMSKYKLRTQQLVDFWKQRWLSMRVKSEPILDKLGEHQLSYPVKHGAKVNLPAEDNPQLELWDDFEG